MSDSLELRYRLARTVVKLDGTVSVDTAMDGTPQVTRATQVSLGCEADPDPKANCTVTIDSGWRDQRKFDLVLAADGRLAGATNSATGLGGQILGAAVTVGTIAAKAAAAVGLLAFAEEKPTTLEDQFTAAEKEVAERRQQLKKALATLEDALVSFAEKAAKGDTGAGAQLKVIEDALSATRTEVSALDAEFQAWRAAAFPTRQESFSYLLDTHDLPTRDAAEDKAAFTASELHGQSDSASKLGVAVARIGDGSERSAVDSERATASLSDAEALFYRVPRRVQLAVYEACDQSAGRGDTLPTDFRLRNLMPAWIIDRASKLERLPLESGFFGQHELAVGFGDTGALTHVTNSDTPAVAGIASALSAAGGQVTGALDSYKKVSDAFASPAPEDPALKALQDQVTRKELEARLAVANKTIAGGTTNSKHQ